MNRILLRSLFVAVVCAAASLIVVLTLVPALGGRVDGNVLIACAICPLLIAWPASAYTFSQNARLKRAHRELARTHAQLAAAHRRLSEKARHDDMTGMLNRESFFLVLDRSQRKADRGALLIIDADHFKAVNDRYGHLVGDDALLQISSALRQGVREGDILGRIGGEEFGAFLVGANEQEARRIAERIRRKVESIQFLSDHDEVIPLTVSIGGTICGEGATVSELMRSADGRLYAAKHGGRNLVIVDHNIPRAA